jgi:general secretion pathway protein G
MKGCFMTYTIGETRTSKSGFSFIELVIALSIIAVLSLVIGPAAFRYFKEAQITTTKNNLKSIKSALQMYNMKIGTYPKTLDALVHKPADVPMNKWISSYLEDVEDVPKDSWGNDFILRLNPAGSAHPFELYSTGPEGGEKIDVWKI